MSKTFSEQAVLSWKERWAKYAGFVFEWSLLLFVPSLFFFRGLNARIIEIGLLAWLVRAVLVPGLRQDIFKTKASLWALFFSLSFLASCWFSKEPISSLRDGMALLHAVLFFVSLQMANLSKEFWKRFGIVVIIALSIVAFDVLYQAWKGVSLVTGESPFQSGPNSEKRVTGPFSNPNLLFVLVIYSSVFLLFAEDKAYKVKWLLWPALTLSLVLISVSILFTESRNIYFAWFLFLLSVAWFRFRWKGVFLVLALSVATVVFTSQGQKTIRRLQAWGTSHYQRLPLWSFSFELWKENPWFGLGPGMFERVFTQDWEQHQDAADRVGYSRPQRTPHHAHNVYLESLVERGALGLVSMLGIIVTALHQLWKRRKCLSLAYPRRALTLGLCLLLFCGLFDFSMSIRLYSYTLFLFCGLAGALSAMPQDRDEVLA